MLLPSPSTNPKIIRPTRTASLQIVDMFWIIDPDLLPTEFRNATNNIRTIANGTLSAAIPDKTANCSENITARAAIIPG